MLKSGVSVLIVCKNAAATISRTIKAAQKLSADVIVLDSGSSDGTPALLHALGVRLITTEWLGFGTTKNKGHHHALNNWILCIDADEELSDTLIHAINDLDLQNQNIVYAVRRLNYLGHQPIRFGEWQSDWVTRLYNRNVVQWDDAPVHEMLQIPASAKVKRLKGILHHHTAGDIRTYQQKLDRYALLMAGKYYAKGKQAHWYNIWLSPAFIFLKNYVVRLGWLDKKAGWHIARAHAHYTFKKYSLLKDLYKQAPVKEQ